MKRFYSVLVVAVMVLMLLPAFCFGADSDFELSSDGKTLVKYNGSDAEVVVPYGVEVIGESAFSSKYNITSVTMPDSVKEIGDKAFMYCSKLKDINWSRNLTKIGNGSFQVLTALTRADIPDSVTSIGTGAFYNSRNLEYVELPSGLKSLGENSFTKLPRLLSVVVPDSLTSIEQNSFKECNSDFVLVAGSSSPARAYAEANGIEFAEKGVLAPYTITNENAALTIKKDGSVLASSGTLKAGDVVYITATTDADDINVTASGKSINYSHDQKTKTELTDHPYIITGKTDFRAEGINSSESIDETLNVPGGDLHFEGGSVFLTVDRGRRVAEFRANKYRTAYVKSEITVSEPSVLTFDLYQNFVYEDLHKVELVIDGEKQLVGETTDRPISYSFELSEGTHTVEWNVDNKGFNVIQLSNVRVSTDISGIKARKLWFTYPIIDLEIGESFDIPYETEPGMVKRNKEIDWKVEPYDPETSTSTSCVSISGDRITGVSRGQVTLTGKVDGLQAKINVFVSGNRYGESHEQAEPTYDDSELIDRRTPLASDIASLYQNGKEVHVKDDKDAYIYSGDRLYRITQINKNARATSLCLLTSNIQYAVSRGKNIYMMANMDSSAGTCRISKYDTEAGELTFVGTFRCGTGVAQRFAVDDEENFYFMKDRKDIYSFDKNGKAIGKDLQSETLSGNTIGTMYIDQVDPFGYSVMTLYGNTEGRSVDFYEEYAFNGMGPALLFPSLKQNFTGFKVMRNGYLPDQEGNYIKNPDVGVGSYWTVLDHGNYAVNSNGLIVKFKKDRKLAVGLDYEVLYDVPDMVPTVSTPAPAAVYAGGDIYVVNDSGMIYRYDTKAGKVSGTYDYSGKNVQSLYAANGKAFAVGNDSEWYATPLLESEIDEAKTIIRHDHITLTYGKSEVESNLKATMPEVKYNEDSEVYKEMPSSTAPYSAGSLTDKAVSEVLARLNYARWQYGINKVTLESSYMSRNQKGAVLMAANRDLSHSQSKPSDMDDAFYDEASKGITAYDVNISSNISYGDSVFSAVFGYLDDTANMDGGIGHRMSLLDRTATKTSFGSCGAFSAMQMYTGGSGLGNDESYYAWPSAGYFPSDVIDPNALWHICTDWYQSKDPGVTLEWNGKEYKATDFGYSRSEDAFSFGLPAELKSEIVKRARFIDGTEITVTMTGLMDKKGNQIVVTYPVRFVKTHEHNYDQGKVTKQATCCEPGEKVYSCFYCNETKTEVIPVDSDAHVWGDWKSTGKDEHARTCSLDKSHVETAAHTWDKGTVTREATETEEGEMKYTCTVCGEVKTVTVPPTGSGEDVHVHTLVRMPAKAATCTEAGNIEYYICTGAADSCGKYFKDAGATEEIEASDIVIPATGHSYGPWKYMNGTYHVRTCENNSNHEQMQRHTWDSGVVTWEATPDEPGEIMYTCTACGYVKTESYEWIPPEERMGEDGTPIGKGASYEAADAAITKLKSESDPAGSKVAPLFVRSTKQTSKSIKLTWKKPAGAKRFVLYGNQCGKKNKMKKIKTLSKTSVTVKKAVKKLKKGKYYKFIVVSLDADNNVVSTSKIIHVATKGGKVGNFKSVKTKAKKNKVKLAVGKTFKLSGKGVPASKKLKVKKHVGIRYESADKDIVTVSKKGVIKRKAKGVCYVYAYSQNGTYARIICK